MADELDAHELLERALTGVVDPKPEGDRKEEPRHKDEKRRRRDRSRSRSRDRKRGSRSRSRSHSRERRPRRCVVVGGRRWFFHCGLSRSPGGDASRLPVSGPLGDVLGGYASL